jgi:glycosyltransferase involved in cell wall biosynthesis
MKINLLGKRNILGGGVHFGHFVDACKSTEMIGMMIKEWDITAPNQKNLFIESVKSTDINVFFFGFNSLLKPPPGFNVDWAIFESDVLSEKYIQNLMMADLVWVPSQWGKSILVNHGLKPEKIDVVTEGVAASTFHPFFRENRMNRSENQVFRFLMLGKYEERKGYQQLFSAFENAYGHDSGVELMIKADYFIDAEKKHQELIQYIDQRGLKNIRIVHGKMSQQDILALYTSADVFVFPVRAEGWGLPLIEALAAGLPVIATNYSGQTEFLSRIPGLFQSLNYKLVPINDPEFKSFWPPRGNTWGQWAEVDVKDLQKKLISSRKNYLFWQDKALQASQIIRQEFDWGVSRDKALLSLFKHGKLPKISFKTRVMNQ